MKAPITEEGRFNQPAIYAKPKKREGAWKLVGGNKGRPVPQGQRPPYGPRDGR